MKIAKIICTRQKYFVQFILEMQILRFFYSLLKFKSNIYTLYFLPSLRPSLNDGSLNGIQLIQCVKFLWNVHADRNTSDIILFYWLYPTNNQTNAVIHDLLIVTLNLWNCIRKCTKIKDQRNKDDRMKSGANL